jgi:hypothetical protein
VGVIALALQIWQVRMLIMFGPPLPGILMKRVS